MPVGMDEEQHYESFNMDNDYEGLVEIDGELLYREKKKKRMQTREDQLYGYQSSDEEDEVAQAPLWKKKAAPARRQRTYKTAEEVLEAAATKPLAAQPILDMRGPQVRLVTDLDQLNQGAELQSVYPTIRHRLTRALTAWHPSDASARVLLGPWQSVFDPSDWEALLQRSIMPKLAQSLQTELVLNPLSPHLDPFHWALSWQGLMPTGHLAALMESCFFPAWHALLHHWLSHSPNYDEVTRWYLDWKAMFPQDALDHPREQGFEFLPRAGRLHDGLQVYSFGGVSCVVDAAHSLVRAQLKDRGWVPVSLEKLREEAALKRGVSS
eukprot:gene6396-6627_t